MSRSINTGAERARASSLAGAVVASRGDLSEDARAHGVYHFNCWRPAPARLDEYIALRDLLQGMLAVGVRLTREAWAEIERIRGRLAQIPLERAWRDQWVMAENLVTTEGKNAFLTHGFKGSAYTASNVLGLIEDTGYSAVAAGNTAANITAAGGGSPANGWNEAPSATCATRGTPSFGTASGGSLATSAAVQMNILATDTIKGAFLLIRSSAGTAPSTTVGNTSGALYSAGLFSGGDRSVANGDRLDVTYTASL